VAQDAVIKEMDAANSSIQDAASQMKEIIIASRQGGTLVEMA